MTERAAEYPSVSEAIERTVTNGTGFDPDFNRFRWRGIEDTLALNSTLGLMDINSRMLDYTLELDFADKALQTAELATMIHGNVDVPRSESRSTPLYHVSKAIEASVTNTRGYEPVPNIRINGIEDSLALSERLGWMKINRSSVLRRSTLKMWSFENMLARMIPYNVDNATQGEKTSLLILTEDDIDQFMNRAVDGNLNAHFGPVAIREGSFPMTWDGKFTRENLGEIVKSCNEGLPISLFEAHRKVLLSA